MFLPLACVSVNTQTGQNNMQGVFTFQHAGSVGINPPWGINVATNATQEAKKQKTAESSGDPVSDRKTLSSRVVLTYILFYSHLTLRGYHYY